MPAPQTKPPAAAVDLAARIRAVTPSVPSPASAPEPATMPRGRDDRRETRESFHIRLPVSVLRHLHTIAGRQTAEHGRRISAQDLVQDLIAREWGDPDAR